MKIIVVSLFLFSFHLCYSQSTAKPNIADALERFGFIEEQVIAKQDTITYYLKDVDKKVRKLVLFIQGTDANPIFSYAEKDSQISYYRWFVDDYLMLDSSYTFAIIPKPGMAGLYSDTDIQIPQEYYEKNHLEYRVRQLDASIEHIKENHMAKPEDIIVYGHSEGAVIGAALAAKNKSITHLGFWSGNVLHNFYEFSLFNRIESIQGNISDKEAHENIMGILGWYASVIDQANSTEIDHFGFTNKRWSSYEKAPLEYLNQLSIPIYALFAFKDQSTPIETAYLLPISFLEKRKDNLTFEVCLECDHSYNIHTEEGEKSLWSMQFQGFMEWTEKSNPETN